MCTLFKTQLLNKTMFRLLEGIAGPEAIVEHATNTLMFILGKVAESADKSAEAAKQVAVLAADSGDPETAVAAQAAATEARDAASEAIEVVSEAIEVAKILERNTEKVRKAVDSLPLSVKKRAELYQPKSSALPAPSGVRRSLAAEKLANRKTRKAVTLINGPQTHIIFVQSPFDLADLKEHTPESWGSGTFRLKNSEDPIKADDSIDHVTLEAHDSKIIFKPGLYAPARTGGHSRSRSKTRNSKRSQKRSRSRGRGRSRSRSRR